jgi:hypothetical protein
MRFSLPLKVMFIAAALAATAPAQAKCMLMSYFDQNGAVIQTAEPVIAMQVGDRQIVERGVPTNPTPYKQVVGPTVPCPAPLVESIRQVFNASCPSAGSRNQAAMDNQAAVERSSMTAATR